MGKNINIAVLPGDGIVFFFKQKTAYEMSSCDWSSDVCSSDLMIRRPPRSNPIVYFCSTSSSCNSLIAISRILNFWILPEAVMG